MVVGDVDQKGKQTIVMGRTASNRNRTDQREEQSSRAARFRLLVHARNDLHSSCKDDNNKGSCYRPKQKEGKLLYPSWQRQDKRKIELVMIVHRQRRQGSKLEDAEMVSRRRGKTIVMG